MRRLKTDILILGSGGAGLFAAGEDTGGVHGANRLGGRAITAAAMVREDSPGAHFLSDHPQTGDLAASRFTSVRLDGGDMVVHTEPVRFTRVEPGETLLADSAAE